MRAFLERAQARGLPIKWFGAECQAGFTSAPRHWRYAGDQGALPATHAVLAQLCDIRTPLSLTDEECDLVAAIVLESIRSVLNDSGESGDHRHLTMPPTATERGRKP
jgi:hypothetical protein